MAYAPDSRPSNCRITTGRWAVLELLRLIESGSDRPAHMWPCRVPLFEGGRRQVSRAGNKVPESGDLGLTRAR
jgi:hypothetical protein